MQVFSALGLGGGWDILWIWTTVIASDKSQDVDQALCVRLDLSGWGVFQSFSHVRFFVTPRTAAHQASLSITISWSLLKLMSIESVMPSSHRILCCPLLLLPSVFPASGSFLMSQLFTSGGQSIGASASVLSMNIQVWFPLGLTGLISLLSLGLSRIFSSTPTQKH